MSNLTYVNINGSKNFQKKKETRERVRERIRVGMSSKVITMFTKLFQ